ncbi:MAG: hypothetical protein HWD58_07965 [Bacteroidota bacterium]|nr:MAG: hypothetical protein HWD58_07965 [Bacteroidota bacterium]
MVVLVPEKYMQFECLRIYDLSGRLIREIQYPHQKTSEAFRLDLTHAESGVIFTLRLLRSTFFEADTIYETVKGWGIQKVICSLCHPNQPLLTKHRIKFKSHSPLNSNTGLCD